MLLNDDDDRCTRCHVACATPRLFHAASPPDGVKTGCGVVDDLDVNSAGKMAGGLVAIVVLASWLPDARSTQAEPVAVRPVDAAPPAAASPPLLTAASGGDGDSWRDSAGREYRLGMVNAPEVGECFGTEATAARTRLVAAGFAARVYAADRHGREVAVVTSADGTNLNVHLAQLGFVDDRYLAAFRHENPALARELDAAFDRAKADRAGLWGACREAVPQGIAAAPPAKKQAPADGACHPDYVTCIPVKGDGSGRGQANDLDCGDLDGRVQLRRAGTDPYRLDGNDDDGSGCE